MDHQPRKPGNQRMSDVAMAREYVAHIGGAGKAEAVIGRTFERLSKMFPHKDYPRERWTYRRVRSFWERDAALVKFREMRELHQAAEAAKAERKLLEEARRTHADFIEKTASLRALLEHQDEAFHSAQIEGLRGVSRGMDCTRNSSEP